MDPIRVIIVDPTPADQRLSATVLGEDTALQIVGLFPDFRAALARIPSLASDLLVFDPGAEGPEGLIALRKEFPELPVIVFSARARRGTPFTLGVLAAGASDYVTKPERRRDGDVVDRVAFASQQVRETLLPRIKLFARSAVQKSRSAPSPSPKAVPAPLAPKLRGLRVEVVVIGVSTGGPVALGAVLPSLPADFPVPVLVVQHMPAGMTGHLAQSLAGQCRLRVQEGREGEELRAGTIWLAPGGIHMGVIKDGAGVRLQLHERPPENFCRPSVDVLFRSAAAVYGSTVFAVVLTGMGQDGLRGCEAVRAAGGAIVAQDEATSVVWGMPGFVARGGLAQWILPLSEIGPHIVRRVGGKSDRGGSFAPVPS